MATNAIQSSNVQPSKADSVRINAATKSFNSIANASVLALADPFNADDVVENPSIEMARPLSGGELVDATRLRQFATIFCHIPQVRLI